ncbi:hypothetical protein BJ508DRAFT_4359 [Ascobolus immersus RN42]|uniref:Uncharacterized protein n=1 Tax=Ascobolus immersus RN42 TaxID=1160509 RepID=A0A3N4IQ02_ASCIM|nr:hypothetical protein BJ508DRAFT_4359 [Ascobolus immersus RN42]
MCGLGGRCDGMMVDDVVRYHRIVGSCCCAFLFSHFLCHDLIFLFNIRFVGLFGWGFHFAKLDSTRFAQELGNKMVFCVVHYLVHTLWLS